MMNHTLRVHLFLFWMVCLAAVVGSVYGEQGEQARLLRLAEGGRANYEIRLSDNPCKTEEFAAQELKKYLNQITGADFQLHGRGVQPEIVLSIGDVGRRDQGDTRSSGEPHFAYSLRVEERDIHLAAAEPRDLLYAVYDFLERLGCRWMAPAFDFYDGQHEYIPFYPQLDYIHNGDLFEAPAYRYRKIDVGEGRSHTTENLKQLIDWMPKARFNVFACPLDYHFSRPDFREPGMVRWDRWREELTPELQKRGILIMTGDHGHQNFINADMEEGRLFRQHPEWFGMDGQGRRRSEHRWIICSSNPEPVEYMIQNVVRYLQERPEVDIFAFWPPDGERWCQCPECEKVGSPSERHALLVNALVERLRESEIHVRVQCIAYNRFENPPETTPLSSDVYLELCPFTQEFAKYIYDPTSENNQRFLNNVYDWLEQFEGEIGIYTYYRKYMWRSLPVVFPRYIHRELQFYHDIGIAGIGTYAEPGDWFTYELNHYVLSKLTWDPQQLVDDLIWDFCKLRYPRYYALAAEIFDFLGSAVPRYSRIPDVTPRPVHEYPAVERRGEELVTMLLDAKGDPPVGEHEKEHLQRLYLMLSYATMEMKIENHRLRGGPEKERAGKLLEMGAFIRENADLGVFLYHRVRLGPERLFNIYGGGDFRAEFISEDE